MSLEGEVTRVAANGVAVVGTAWTSPMRAWNSLGARGQPHGKPGQHHPMRKVRLFQPDAYLSVDLLNRSAQVMKLEDVAEGNERDPYGIYLDVPGRTARRLHIEEPEVGEANAIADELADFHAACSGKRPAGCPSKTACAACAWPPKSWTA